MATVEVNTASTDGDQPEKRPPPSEEDSVTVIQDSSAQLNFSGLTPCQFGISVQSFTPASVSNRKDKSRLAQIKARRRSSVGVRGSPETNSLIRFMAQQRIKTPTTHKTPELVRSSPLLPRVAPTLRQKMASFQNLMDVEESEVCDPTPRQDSSTGGCIKTRDYLSDGNSSDGEKENHPLTTTPIPSKRRRLGPQEGCEVEIREASTPTLHLNLKEQEEDAEPVTQAVTQGPQPSSNTVDEAHAVPALHGDSELQACSPTRSQQQHGFFELQSPSQPPSDDPAAASTARLASSLHTISLPSLLEMKPTGEDNSTGMSTIKNKKRVRFGGPLSPELFDKNLPPSTPLQKGATPVRAPTPGGSLQLRSLLKTPQGSDSQAAQAEADLCSPTLFASPTFVMLRSHRLQPVDEDRVEKDGKFVVMEADSIVMSFSDSTWEAQPLNLTAAFHEESLCQIQTESEINTSTASQMGALEEPTVLLESEKQVEADITAAAVTPSRNSRKKQPAPECEHPSKAPARPSSRKRKQSEESEPVKRSTRSAAKSASGKMKMVSAVARRWNRDVDRSLYGSRAYASKNPTLSPITERLSFISPSAAAQHTGCTAPNHETHLNPELANGTQGIGDFRMTNNWENASDFVTSPNSRKESFAGRSRRLSGPRVSGRGLKRKVRDADGVLLCEETQSRTEGETEEHCEDQTANLDDASSETPLTNSAPEQGGAAREGNTQTCADAHHTHLDGKRLDSCHGSLDAPTSDSPPSGEECVSTLPLEPAQRKARGCRNSPPHSSDLPEQGSHTEEHQTSLDGEVRRAASQQENNIWSSSDSQEEGGIANLDLAPWQADFNFEDVFKPVAARGQRSVRRSLRNQASSEHSNNTGLAWLPRTSPDSKREARRRTRGRRRSAAPPAQASVPEETRDDASNTET